MSFKIRLTEAVSGLTSHSGIERSSVELDPGEYFINTHPSGHLQVELPESRVAYLPFIDFESGVRNGIIKINY